MIDDFALEAQRKQGLSPAEADLSRLPRPVPPHHDDDDGGVMGTLPIALVLAGGEALRPLGVSVVGGLAFSQVVTLFLTPVFLYLHGRRKAVGKRERSAVSGKANPKGFFLTRAYPHRAHRGSNRSLRGCAGTCQAWDPRPSLNLPR